jgi:hypothetical protein
MLRWHSHTRDYQTCFGARVQAAPFYTHSENSSQLGKYFLFQNKKELRINKDSTIGDVHPYNFNLDTNYDSKISLHPKQETYGVQLDYFQHLSNLFKGLYWSASSSIVHVENDPGLRETVTTGGSSALYPSTATEAFRGHLNSSDWSDQWRYGKIDGRQEQTGLADIDVKLGYTIFDSKKIKLAANIAGIIPTGNRATGVYVFEPFVGNGHFWALGAGIDATAQLYHWNKHRYLHASLAADYRYLFENDQVRTLELKNKNWGRYIRMRQQNPSDSTKVLQNSFPGINIMTRKVNVTPGSQLDAMLSLCFKYNRNWHFNLGYNLWCREQEKVSLKNSWENPGTYGLIASTTYNSNTGFIPSGYLHTGAILYTQATDGTAQTTLTGPAYVSQFLPATTSASAVSSQTTINSYATGTAIDGKFIQASDLDMCGHPFALSHKIFGGVDYTFKTDYRIVTGLWGSYEFASSNTALDQWSLWLKVGTQF